MLGGELHNYRKNSRFDVLLWREKPHVSLVEEVTAACLWRQFQGTMTFNNGIVA
jgi:hypothetical protein